jgi:hypothetical protein
MATKTLSTSATEVLPRNRLRKSWIIQNEDTSIDVFIKLERAATPTVSSTDHDHLVAAGGSLALNTDTDGTEAIQDRWTGIAASGTPRISFFETEDLIR